jgi:hypothetical protein
MSNDPYLDITIDAMSTALHHNPRGFQRDVIPYVLKMKRATPNPIHPVLLVQGTGGGKSSVYQTIGIIKQGVSLIIENTLSLSSDQLSKIKQISERVPNVHSFQLDSLKTASSRTSLATQLSKVHSNSNTTIFLFSSPESVIREPWQSLLSQLITKNVLRQVCIDEVHLFVMFAITFRHSFLKLKNLLFNQLIDNNTNIPSIIPSTNPCVRHLKVPILFMTATFNAQLLHYLERIVGFTIPYPSTFWSDRSTFARRNISINISSSFYKMKMIKNSLSNTLEDNEHKKAIIYCNTASAVDKIRDELDNWLNEATTKIEGDTIIINGDLESEWKFFSAQRFTQVTTNPQECILNNIYYPRILIATSGCIGAGLDSSSVYSVIRDGFPSSVLDLIQEMGRCGRGRSCGMNNLNTNVDSFDINVQLSSFVYMIERILNSKPLLDGDDKKRLEQVISQEELVNFQIRNLVEVVEFIYINCTTCWHKKLEEKSVLASYGTLPLSRDINIDASSLYSDTCLNACPACNHSYLSYIKPISRIGLTQFIVHTFILTQSGVITPAILIQKLSKYKDVGIVVYKKRVVTAPTIQIMTSTVMQLIASQIVLIKPALSNDVNICSLSLNVINEYGRLSHEDDRYWEGILLI